MAHGPAVGDSAPPLRLPCAQGGFYARKAFKRLWRPAPLPVDFGPSGPFGAPVGFRQAPGDVVRVFADEDTGFFVVDRHGVVRFADRGGYRGDGGRGALRPIPSRAEVLAVLERLAS